MPSTITHAYFSLDVYDKLDNKTKRILKNNTSDLKVYAQGPDPLYFYNLMIPIVGRNIRKIFPRKLHDTKTKDFLITLVNEIKEQKLEKNSYVMSMLYGYITHYVLDSTIHPYIIYKTGIYDKNIEKTKKYKSVHLDMELYLDGYMIFQREKMPIKDFKTYRFCFDINSNNQQLKELLNKVVSDVYDIENYSKYYFKAINHMKFINRVFRYDKYGIKRIIYIFMDKILPKKQLKKEQLSYHIDYRKKLHYLNNEKIEWCHPMDEYETYNYSFIELYHIALNKAVKIINDINSVIYDNVDIKVLDKNIENISYKTGKDCKDNRKLQYFEY